MAKLTVIGAGLVGLMTAREAVLQGLSVTIVEDGNVRPASLAAGGMLGTLAEADDASAFALSDGQRRAAFERWRALLHMHQWEPVARSTWVMGAAQACGRALPHDALHPRVLFSRVLESDWAVDPVAIHRALTAWLRSEGCIFVSDQITSVEHTPSGVFATQGRSATLYSDSVVIAAGHLANLIDLPHVAPTLVPVAGQMLLLDWSPDTPLTVVIREGAHYLIPRSRNSVVVGATVRSGERCEVPEIAASEDLRAWAGSVAPTLASARALDEWVGIRPRHALPEDQLVQKLENGLIWTNGHYRNGILMSVASAARAVELIRQG